ncbi:odorant receptor 43a-like isoform X2 [Choristoneura fumiferana]|uniref:odorant receptor 43a-like isoform X2 n=1 Tax=Choristoneura fumiferana TaxID=7141 RepID=UPI003D15D3EE
MKQISECLRIAFLVLIIAGIWYPASWENSRYLYLINIYRVLAMTIILIGTLTIQSLYFCTVFGVDLEKTIDAVSLFIFYTLLVKAISIIKRKGRINKLLEIIDEEEDIDDLMKGTAAKIKLMCEVYIGGCLVTAILWTLIPFTQPSLYLPFFYPDVPPDSPSFVRWYVYEAVILVIDGVSQPGFDCLFGGLMAFAATQFKLLQYKLDTIGRDETDEIDAAQKEQNDYNKAVSCVKFHVKIIRVVDELTSIFGAGAFSQFAVAGPLLCLSVFIIITSTDPIEMLTRVLYLCTLTGQLFFYCFCGELIKTQSDRVATAAYLSSWETTSLRTQKALKLLMLRAQKTESVVAGNLFELSLITFGTILKSSYSFFAVLNEQRNT